MSKNKTDEELLLEQFEEMLGLNIEEDFGYFSIPNTRFDTDSDDDLGDKKDLPPPLPDEVKCEHKEKEVRTLIFSQYYICKKCGKDLGDKK